MKMEIKEQVYVKLKDGREGTIVHVFPAAAAFLIELPSDDELDIVEIKPEDIDQVIKKPSS